MKHVTPTVIRFGAFEVDPRTGRLHKHGIRIKLREQPFQILLLLLERPGDLVTREELRAKLWPSDTFVDFDHGLNAAVNKLREALGDRAEAPCYVETLPRRGYRFIGTVSTSAAEEASHATAAAIPRRRWYAGRAAAAVAGVLLIVAAGSFFAWRHFWRRAQPAGKIMLAVLPFQNLSGDPAQEYFSDGLTEEMTTQLGSLQPERLGVIARTSAMRYKGTQKSAAEIGQELRVDYALEGSLRRIRDHVRISAQLIQVKDQTHLWAKNYDRQLGDILLLESEVAQAIATEIRLKLTLEQQMRLAGPRGVNPEAYDSYLKGRYLWNMRTPEGLKKSLEYFHQAIEKDPGYALAHAGLADAYNILGNWGSLAPKQAYPKAKAAASKALEIDDQLAEAHISLAFASYLFDRDWSAEEGFKRAIALNPNYGPAHQWYGVCLVSTGRVDEAIAEAKRARELEPFSLIINAVVGWVSFLGHRYDQAIEACRQTLEMDQSFSPAHEYLAMAYEAKGMYDQAIGEFQNLSRRTPFTLGVLGHTYAMAGKKAEAQKILGEMKERANRAYFPPYQIALVYAGMGESDQAFHWLEKALEERDEQNDQVVVRRAGRYTSQDVHRALFPSGAPKKAPIDVKEAIKIYIRKRHARR